MPLQNTKKLFFSLCCIYLIFKKTFLKGYIITQSVLFYGKGRAKSSQNVKFNLQGHFQGQIDFFLIFDLEILCLTLKMTLTLISSELKIFAITQTILSDRRNKYIFYRVWIKCILFQNGGHFGFLLKFNVFLVSAKFYFVEIFHSIKAIMLQKIIKINREMMFLQLILCQGSKLFFCIFCYISLVNKL